MRFVPCCLALLLASFAAVAAESAPYPSRPVKIIVASSPGGPADLLARGFAQRLTERMGATVAVENRPGANSILGADAVAKAAPDGYTLLLTTGTPITINQHLFAKLPYNPATDLVPVGKMAMNYYVMYGRASLPFDNARDFVAYAKANPAKLSMGLNGVATPPHFAVKNLEHAAGITFNIVQYKGATPAFNDLVAGHVDLVLEGPSIGLPFVKAGTVKAVAVTSPTRLATLPNVTPLAELYAGFEASSWFGLMAPAGTPPEIVMRLNREVQDFVADPATRERLSAQGMVPESGPVAQLAEYIRAETMRWGEVVRRTGIRLDP